MNITLRQLRYVCAVAEEGSVQAASRAMNISPSSILAAIEVAEHELGARIFDRRRANGMQITPAGDRFVVEGGRLLAASAEFENQVGVLRSDAIPTIKIGCFEPFGAIFMVQALKYLRGAGGQTEVSLFEGDQLQLRDWLDKGVVDVVVTYDLGPNFGDSVTRLCKVPAHALVSRESKMSQRQSITMAELAEVPLILLDLPMTSSYLLTLFDLVGVKPHVGFRTRSYETVRSAVAAGFGAAIMNMRPVGHDRFESGDLVRLPISDDLPIPNLIIADLYGEMKPRAIERLITSFTRFFRERNPDEFAVVTPERRHLVFG